MHVLDNESDMYKVQILASVALVGRSLFEVSYYCMRDFVNVEL